MLNPGLTIGMLFTILA